MTARIASPPAETRLGVTSIETETLARESLKFSLWANVTDDIKTQIMTKNRGLGEFMGNLVSIRDWSELRSMQRGNILYRFPAIGVDGTVFKRSVVMIHSGFLQLFSSYDC